MKKHALICEDSPTTALLIKDAIEKLNYSAKIAKTANETLKLLNKNKYDLLTLDLLLPDENGIDIIKKMQDIELAKDLPIIIISATKKEAANLDFKNNVVYWLEKSFDMKGFDELIKKINNEKSKNTAEILHIENDQDLLNLIEITISDIANVTQAKDLTIAKDCIEKKAFDIIILDFVFPEGTSDKLIPVIKSGLNKDAKLIVFSAYEEKKLMAKYVDKSIIKTDISFDELKDCIEKFISNKE